MSADDTPIIARAPRVPRRLPSAAAPASAATAPAPVSVSPEDGVRAIEEAMEVHAGWSDANRRFLEFALANPEVRSRASFASLHRENPLVKFTLQPWPFFYDAARKAELERVAVGLDRLVKSVPERFFGGDAARVSAFYHVQGPGIFGPAMTPGMAELVLAEPNGIAGMPSRADYVETAEGLQILEMNATGALGGLHIPRLEAPFLRTAPVARFLAESGVRARQRDPVEFLLRHTMEDAAAAGVWDGGEMAVAVVVRPHDAVQVAMHTQVLWDGAMARALAAQARVPAGRVPLVGPEELKERGGGLEAGGRRVHAVIEQHDGSADLRAAFRAAKAGRVVLYSGPVATLLCDKRNLALLSEHARSDELTAAERELVERHVPWTRHVAEGETAWRGGRRSLLSLLAEEREAFVLKKASSLGGRHVVVGRHETGDAWRAAVARALQEGDWIVQAYAPSVPYCFLGADGPARYTVVWGLFAFGPRFGGAFVRLAPAGQGRGVVNAGEGEVGLLLEAEG